MCWSGCSLDYTVVIVLAVGLGWGSRSGVQPGAVGARTRKNYLTPGPISAAQLNAFVHTIGNARWPSMSSGAGADCSPPRRRIDQGPCWEPRGMPGSIINLTGEAVQRDQGIGSLDKSAERKDLAPEVDIHQPDDLKRLPAAPEADVDGCSVGRGPMWPPRVLSRDLSPEHSVDAPGKALATVEIRYLATFWDPAKQIVSW